MRFDIDAAFITTRNNVEYLCGHGEDSFLLVTKDKALFFTDSRYGEAAERAVKGAKVFIWKDDLFPFVRDKAVAEGVRKLGFEAETVTIAQKNKMEKGFEGIDISATEGLVKRLRLYKTADEVEKIKKAISIADRSLEATLELLKPGITEADLARELRYNIALMGGQDISFAPIIAFGSNASLPHAKPGDRILGENVVVQFDWGAKYAQYCSDCSRVFFVGDIGDELKKVYNIVLEANRRAISAIKFGVALSRLDAIARDYIREQGYGDYFGHGLGHGVGLDVHEEPSVSARGDKTVEPGLVFTIEPGIYLPGRGGVRIEDMVYITEVGYEVLTSFPYDPRPGIKEK